MKDLDLKNKFGFNVLKQFKIEPEMVNNITHNIGGSYTIETVDTMETEPFDIEAVERGASIIYYDKNGSKSFKEYVSGFKYCNGKRKFKDADICVNGVEYTTKGINYKGDTVLFMRKGYKVELSLRCSLKVSNDLCTWYNAEFVFQSKGGAVYCAVNDRDEYDVTGFINFKDTDSYIENLEAVTLYPFKYYKNIYY